MIASDDTFSGRLTAVSLVNLRHAALVGSSNSPFTLPSKQPTRLRSSCSNRANREGRGAFPMDGCTVPLTSDVSWCSALARAALLGN